MGSDNGKCVKRIRKPCMLKWKKKKTQVSPENWENTTIPVLGNREDQDQDQNMNNTNNNSIVNTNTIIKEETRKDELSNVFGNRIILIYIYEYLMIELCEYNWHISKCNRLIYLRQKNKNILIELDNGLYPKMLNIASISVIKPVVMVYVSDTIPDNQQDDTCWENRDGRLHLVDDKITKWHNKMLQLSETISKCIRDDNNVDINYVYV
jgi:hypothetical protein